MEKHFSAIVSKMGRKRMINVPAKQESFEVGQEVKVSEVKE